MKVRQKMANWKKKLADLFGRSIEEQGQMLTDDTTAMEQQEATDKFLCTIVDSALRDLALELHKYERKACTFGGNKLSRDLEIRFQNRLEFRYFINIFIGAIKITVHTSYMARFQSGSEEQGEGIIMKDGKQANIAEITKEDIINDFLKQYIVRQSSFS